MKKNLIYAGMLLLGIMVATSCSNEEHLEQMMSNGNTVQAVIENVANTRTSVNESYQVVWTTEDKFDVWDDNEFKGVLKLISGAGTTSASYGDADPDNPVNATSGMTAFFPSYDGTPNKKAFVFLETYDSQETDAPMLGSFDGSKFTFNLLTAMVRVVVADVPAGEISFTISSKNNEILTGEAALDEDGKLSVPASGATSVSVNFTTTEAKTLTFDVPIPIQDYTNGLNVIVKSGANKILDKTTNRINASAGILYLFNDAYVSVNDADGASTELAKNEVTAVKVASVAAGDDITIPAKSETSADVMHTIDLSDAALPTSGTVNINVTEATDNAKSTVKKLTVVVPNGTSESSLNINAPGTTVIITSENGTIIDALEATTAEETLIISKNVTVNTLKIKKGHVRVHGSIGNISRVENNSDEVTYIIVEEGATIKDTTVGEGCVKVSAAEYDLLEAIENATENSTVTLEADIDLSAALKVGKTLTLDMNGHTLTSSGDGIEVTSGTLTIEGDGTVAAGSSDQWVAIWANGGNVVIENGTYSVGADADGYTNDCIYAKGGTITINGGTFSNTGTYSSSRGGVVINAHNTVTNSKVIVNAGTFKPAEGCIAYEESDRTAGRIEWNIAPVTEEELVAAIENATEESTVTLGADIDLSAALKVGKTLTLDMNGHTLTSSGDGIEVTSGTLTIEGDGTVAAGSSDQWVAIWANGGNVVIENGTYSVGADADGYTNDCIYAKGGTITINGGTFSNTGTYDSSRGGVVINAHNTVENSKVIVNAGTFKPAEGCIAYEESDRTAGRIEWNIEN